MTITFSDNLLTGNQTIDTQHRELFDRIDRFVDICENGGGKVEAINMLSYLMDYTDFHFAAEEELQKSGNYPEIEQHMAKHVEFVGNLKDLEEFLNDLEGPTDEFVNAVKTNVINWFTFHIETFDRSVAEYLNLHTNPDLV